MPIVLVRSVTLRSSCPSKRIICRRCGSFMASKMPSGAGSTNNFFSRVISVCIGYSLPGGILGRSAGAANCRTIATMATAGGPGRGGLGHGAAHGQGALVVLLEDQGDGQ